MIEFEWRPVPLKKGETHYCVNGHPIFTLKKDMRLGEGGDWGKNLKYISPQKRPLIGLSLPDCKCTICSDPYFLIIEQ